MGHLISIFELLSENCSANDEYRALVESSFDSDRDDEKRLADWQQIQAPEVGELTNELHLQKTFLVNYSPILFIFYLYFIFHAGLFFLTIQAGIDPYATDEEDFNTSLSIENENFAADSEASERFAQVNQ